MLLRSRRQFIQWLTSNDPTVAPVELRAQRLANPINWQGSSEWDGDPEAIDRAREHIEAGRVISFRILCSRNQPMELTRATRRTVTDIENGGFYIGGSAEGGSVRLKNLNIRRLAIFVGSGVATPAHISNCWIDEVRLGVGRNANLLDLTLENAWIGRLDFSDAKFRQVQLVRGGLLSIRSPLADDPPNPFRGTVTIGRKFYLPRRDGEYKGQSFGHLDWTSLRMQLAAVGNPAAAGRAHSIELTFERAAAPWPTRTVSWLYGALGDYGNSIGRPILCLAVSWFVGLSFIVYTGAKLAQPDAMYRNWKSILVGSSFCAQFLRSALLSIEPILPLGLIRREPLVEAATPFLASIQAAQSYISAVLFFLLAVAIRRKFRISAGSS
jgi:hypothetical protein